MMHEENCECAVCRDGIEKVLEWEDKCMKKYGWYAHFVPDPDMPLGVNFHTHGLGKSYNHPDIQIVFPLKQEIAHDLLRSAVDLIKEGKRFKHNDVSDKVIKHYDVKFVSAIEADRFVLRMIVPDAVGNLLEHELEEPFSLQYADKGSLVSPEDN